MTNSGAQIETEPTEVAPVAGEDFSPAFASSRLRKFKPGLFAVGVGLSLLVLFPSVFFQSHVFVLRDFSLFAYPLAQHYRDSLLLGELPLWNPLNNFGLPFLAQWNTMVLYPANLVYLLLPLPWALSVFCLVHLFLAALGMYFLAARWTRDGLAAALAGIAFAFNGLTLNSLMWPNNIAALGWMPWVVLLVDQGWREGGRAWLKAAWAGALQMLTGAPEIIAFTWLCNALLWLGQGRDAPVTRCRGLGRFGGIVATVAALAAVQLLPFLELLGQSQRDSTFANDVWSMPVWGWANLLVPLYRCHTESAGILFQHAQRWTSSYYLGAGVLALAVVTVLQVRDRRVRLLALLTGLGLVLALGEQGGVLAWLRRLVPQVGLMRFPIKFVVLASFAVPLLAAYAVAEGGASLAEASRRRRRSVGVGLVFLALISFVVWYAHEHPFPEEEWRRTARDGFARASFLVLTVAALCLTGWARKERLRLAGCGGLIVLVWLDLVTHAPSLNPTVDSAIYDSLPSLQTLQPKPEHGQGRLLLSFNAMTIPHRILPDLSHNYLCNRLRQLHNCNLLEGFPKADGFFSLHLRAERSVHYNLYESTNEVRAGLADFLGICQVTDDNEPFQWKPRTTGLPLITAGQKPVFVDDRGALAHVLAPHFDPRRVVYLPPEAKGVVTVADPTEMRIISPQVSAHRLAFEVEGPQAGLVVLAQSFYPAWKAYVDGAPVRLWRANSAFQALQVPAGRHQLRIAYRDRTFQVGALLSLATLLACGLAWWRAGPGGTGPSS